MFVHGLQCKMVSARTHHLNIHVGWNHFLVLWQRLELYFHVEHLACIFICAVYHILVNSGLWRDVFHETFKTNDNAIYKSYIFGPSNALCCDSLWFCVTMNPMQKSALYIVCMSPRFFAWAVLLHWLMAVAGQPVRQHSFMDFPWILEGLGTSKGLSFLLCIPWALLLKHGLTEQFDRDIPLLPQGAIVFKSASTDMMMWLFDGLFVFNIT